MNVDEKVKAVMNEWRVVLKKGREDSIRMLNDGYEYMEAYLEGLSLQKKEAASEKEAE
jgi:hypothetical protein